MARFWYISEETEGQQHWAEADNLPAALLTLQEQGVKIKSGGQYQPPLSGPPRVSEKLLVPFYEQLASLLEQGVELSIALRRMAAEAASYRLGRCLSMLANRVADGLSLSEAMAEQPHIFAHLVVNVIAAGETAGNLAEGLESLSHHQRSLERLGARLALPLAYPVFLLMVIIGLTTTVTTFIWPKYYQLYTDLGLSEEHFPWPTILVGKGIGLLPVVGVPLIILLVALTIFYQVRVRTKAGHLEVRPLGLPVPLLGALSRDAALARTASALRILLKAGVAVGPALRLAGAASGNRHVSLAMRRAEHTVNNGGRVAEGLRATGLLPDAFVFSLGSAEASGDLLNTLRHVESDYMARVNERAQNWVTLAGPIIVLILGFIVGLLAVSMFMPLIEIISQLSQ